MPYAAKAAPGSIIKRISPYEASVLPEREICKNFER